MQQEVSRLQREKAELIEAQDQMCGFEGKLEAQLQEHNAEAGRLKQELDRLHKLSQVCRESRVAFIPLTSQSHGHL